MDGGGSETTAAGPPKRASSAQPFPPEKPQNPETLSWENNPLKKTSDYGFQAALGQFLPRATVEGLRHLRRSSRGRKAKLPASDLFYSFVFHFLCRAGTWAEHLRQLTGQQRAESTLSERRQALSWTFFTECLRLALRPLARRRKHPDAFYRGWRLLAVDGTQFSLTNTPQILRRIRKAATRRAQAAWAKLDVVVLLELGLHNPLAVAVAERQERSEYVLAQRLWTHVPPKALLLGDRLYGCPAMIASLWPHFLSVHSHFLLRARHNLKIQVIRSLPDGSALVRVAVNDPHKSRRVLQWLSLREIRIHVKRPGTRAEVLRLWTSLTDWRSAPAMELARLYTRRWQQELYWRQMKLELRKTEVLQSHTPETAAQEVAALVLATALIAQERVRIAAHQVPVLNISFVKCLELIRPLWQILALATDVLTSKQRKQIVQRILDEIGRCQKNPPRARSCARAVRQPVTGWPRLLKTKYAKGSWSYRVLTPKTTITERH